MVEKIKETERIERENVKLWREMVNEDNSIYYLNTQTQEKNKEPPLGWADYVSKCKNTKWIKLYSREKEKYYYFSPQYQEMLWWKPPGYVDEVDLEIGKCVYCHVNTATRLCNNCEAQYCTVCYLDLHNTRDKRSHVFKEIKPDEVMPYQKLYCVLCRIHRATRRCCVCNEVYCENCHNAKHLKGSTVTHLYKIFQPDCIVCSQCMKVPADKTCRSVLYFIYYSVMIHFVIIVLKNYIKKVQEIIINMLIYQVVIHIKIN